jgi:hypothetical protein
MIFDDLHADFTTIKGVRIITYFQIHSILTNKANLRNEKMNIYIDMISNYKILSCSPGPKNKPNSNPIKPISNPIKANTKPFLAQNQRLCADSEPYDCFNNATRGFYLPQGCQLKPISLSLKRTKFR